MDPTNNKGPHLILVLSLSVSVFLFVFVYVFFSPHLALGWFGSFVFCVCWGADCLGSSRVLARFWLLMRFFETLAVRANDLSRSSQGAAWYMQYCVWRRPKLNIKGGMAGRE